MADTSVVAGASRPDGSIPYELGKPNWQGRRIPDIRNPASTVTIGESVLIDVLILGDGFQTGAEFEAGLQSWIDDFYDLKAYDLFKGAFRVRGLYRRSSQRASADRNSYYRVRVTEDDLEVEGGNWWEGDSGDDLIFRQRVFADIDSFTDINQRRYPSGLSFGETNTTIGDWLFGMYRNLVVSILVRTSERADASGRTFRLARPAPNEDCTVRVGTGANEIHEFSHALGLLSDEYINGRGTLNTRVNPARDNILNLSNLTYSMKVSDVPWFHISPWGREHRQAAGDEPSPLLGWAWVGGSVHIGVWHSEYQCLMNGTHDNFQYTQVAANDPTAQPDGSYIGAGLRVSDRFCLWCQEIIAMRILERTDQLQESGDPLDFVAKGQEWYVRWKDELRDKYWELFDVTQQILDVEGLYAAMTPGPAGEALETSDLYVPFSEDTPTHSGASTFGDDEWLVLLG